MLDRVKSSALGGLYVGAGILAATLVVVAARFVYAKAKAVSQ